MLDRTVSVVQGDNSAIHAALTVVRKGEILVVDGGGFLDRAIWGGIMNLSAKTHGLEGVVIDGSIRDISEINEMGMGVFAAGFVPTGPNKGAGGKIDISISCGNVVVKSGDIVLGDDDGIAIVPLEKSEEVFKLCEERIKMENSIIKKIKNGIKHKDIFNIGEIPVNY